MRDKHSLVMSPEPYTHLVEVSFPTILTNHIKLIANEMFNRQTPLHTLVTTWACEKSAINCSQLVFFVNVLAMPNIHHAESFEQLDWPIRPSKEMAMNATLVSAI